MSDIEREAFEKWLKYEGFDNSRMFSAIAWQGWRAARAQGGEAIAEAYMQGQIDAGINPSYSTAKAYASTRQAPASGEPVAYMFSDEYGRTKIVLGKETAEHWCPPDETVTPLFTHPPAKVPEGWAEIIDRIVPDLSPEPDQSEYPAEWSLWADRQRVRKELALLTTPTPATTPETEWVKCSERLPTETDADCFGEVWLFESGFDVIRFRVDAIRDCPNIAAPLYWMPTGFNRPTPPQEQ